MTPCLETHIGSLRLKTPLMPASGTFGYGDEYLGIISYEPLGAIVTKSLSLKPKRGNPPPRIHELPCGMLNSIGLENVGIKRFLEEKLPRLSELGLPVVVSIFGESEEEFLRVGESLKDAPSVSALEVNLSCPNVRKGGAAFGADPERVFHIIDNLKERVDLPLWAKLPPDPFHILEIAEAAQKAGAHALTLVNTLPAMAMDIQRGRPVLGGITGGLSGPALMPVALKMVYEVTRKLKIPVVAAGGISRWEDAMAFLLAGASALQIGTALFSNPRVFSEVHEGILRFMRERGMTTIEDLRGKAHEVEDHPL